MTNITHIAVLDDEQRMAQILAMVLRREGYTVSTFNRGAALLETMEETTFDLLLTDLRMPEMDGLQVLDHARQRAPDMPVILVTAHATVKTAITAMQRGAFDYVEKPFDNDACRALVKRALDHTALQRENRYLRAELRSRYALGHIIAESDAMRDVFDLARRAARGRATVLVSGESGTGKELVARAVHYHSERVGKPFVAINCKALNPGVLESELFGHDKGAYTGASRARAGVFERADGGTLFLDEIGEIDLDFQAKLLRVLQEREVTRVGGQRPISVDVRIIAATNRNLKDDIKEGRFREDLYFRLAVIPVRIPPLRDRRDDIFPLARFFLQRYNDAMGRRLTGWDDDVERHLTTHAWPGNVRELENTIERAVVLARSDTLITGDDLLLEQDAPGEAGVPAAGGMNLHDFLDLAARERIKAALAQANGVKQDAAAILGVERTTLYRLIKKLGVDA